MGIFTELSTLYSKYKPTKREFRQHARPAYQYNGASEAFRCAHQYPQGG